MICINTFWWHNSHFQKKWNCWNWPRCRGWHSPLDLPRMVHPVSKSALLHQWDKISWWKIDTNIDLTYYGWWKKSCNSSYGKYPTIWEDDELQLWPYVEEILHQLRLVAGFSHYLQGFMHARWLFGISSINNMILEAYNFFTTANNTLGKLGYLSSKTQRFFGDQHHWGNVLEDMINYQLPTNKLDGFEVEISTPTIIFNPKRICFYCFLKFVVQWIIWIEDLDQKYIKNIFIL